MPKSSVVSTMPVPKRLVPHAVDCNARSERVCGAHRPARQGQAIARHAGWQGRKVVRCIRFHPFHTRGVVAALEHRRVGQRGLFPRHLRDIAAGRELVKLRIERMHLRVGCLEPRIDTVEVELARHVPLVLGPLRNGLGGDLRYVVFKRQAAYFVRRERAAVKPDVLVTEFLGGVRIGRAPAELHGCACTNGFAVERVAFNHRLSGIAVDENLYPGRTARAVVSEEHMAPFAVGRQRLDAGNSDCDQRSGIRGRLLLFGLFFFLFFFLFRLLLVLRLVGGELLFR
jgi:hypothetical protein